MAGNHLLTILMVELVDNTLFKKKYCMLFQRSHQYQWQYDYTKHHIKKLWEQDYLD